MKLRIKVRRVVISIICAVATSVILYFDYTYDDEKSSVEFDPIPFKNFQYFGEKVSNIYTPGFSRLPSQICNEDDTLKLLIVVASNPENFQARKAIRYAWGDLSYVNQVQIVFLIGSSSAAMESKITDEILRYGDIIRGKFIDNDKNLTLKTISMLEWVSTNCPKARFILKINDETFVNAEKILQIIDSQLFATKSIYGNLVKSLSYPDFISGPAYMMTSDCVEPLYKQALTAKYLKNEDVFVTGIIANLVGIKKINTGEFKAATTPLSSKCDLRNSATTHGITADQHYDLWFTLNDNSVNCD